MAVNTRTFSALVQTQAAAIQGRARSLIDFSVGSVLRANVESNSGVALWLQAWALRVLATTRAATSVGLDLDSWVNDFGVYRLGAQSSIGSVTYSRFSSSAQAIIPLGATVQTADGTQSFFVVLDPLNTSYNAGLGGYVIPAGVASLSVPVNAVTPGSAANAVAAFVNVITSTVLYVDTVTNAGAMAGGGDAESDLALRARFLQFIQSLRSATALAIGYAITSNRLGVTYTLTESLNVDGSAHLGYFYVVVDDGTGSPAATLVSSTFTAVNAVRAAGILFAVLAPTPVTVAVSMTLTMAAGYDPVSTRARVGTAVSAFLQAIPLGQGVPYTKLAQLAYEASPGVTNVASLLLNSAVLDIAGLPTVKLLPGTVVIS